MWTDEGAVRVWVIMMRSWSSGCVISANKIPKRDATGGEGVVRRRVKDTRPSGARVLGANRRSLIAPRVAAKRSLIKFYCAGIKLTGSPAVPGYGPDKWFIHTLATTRYHRPMCFQNGASIASMDPKHPGPRVPWYTPACVRASVAAHHRGRTFYDQLTLSPSPRSLSSHFPWAAKSVQWKLVRRYRAAGRISLRAWDL